MDEEQILLAFGGIGAASLGCQWLTWRLKLPAILFLLLSGILAGPIRSAEKMQATKKQPEGCFFLHRGPVTAGKTGLKPVFP